MLNKLLIPYETSACCVRSIDPTLGIKQYLFTSQTASDVIIDMTNMSMKSFVVTYQSLFSWGRYHSHSVQEVLNNFSAYGSVLVRIVVVGSIVPTSNGAKSFQISKFITNLDQYVCSLTLV